MTSSRDLSTDPRLWDRVSRACHDHALEAMVVTSLDGSVVSACGDEVTCRALAAFTASAFADVRGDRGRDDDDRVRCLHCGRIVVAQLLVDGIVRLVGAIGLRAIAAPGTLLDALPAAA